MTVPARWREEEAAVADARHETVTPTFIVEVHVSATFAPVAQSDKRILPAALLCFFFGIFGAHRFYVGKIGTGFLELFTLGGCGIWWMVDFILIVTGSFRDEDDQKITEWT